MTDAPGRVCFLLRVRPDRLDSYLEAHRHVWNDMREALEESGWHDYTLFVDRETGLVVAHLLSDDFEAAQRRMALTEVNTRWQAAMADYFDAVDERVEPGDLVMLEEYFHLD